jgi:hypothetical protein
MTLADLAQQRSIALVSACCPRDLGLSPSNTKPNHPIPITETAMGRLIEVTVSPTGETTVQTKGYTGTDCLQASKLLELALGVVTSDRKTAELYTSAQAEQSVEQ